MLAMLALLALLASLAYDRSMATIVIRNLDPVVKRRLQVRAALNGRSMEAEAREVLDTALDPVAPPATGTKRAGHSQLRKRGLRKQKGFGTALHELFASAGGVDLKIPPRTFSTRKPPTFD